MADKQIYGDPGNYAGGGVVNSSIGPQIRTDFYRKKALIEAQKEQYFGQMADTLNMPRNYGKRIKMYHYLPLLDDANVNDQGIDANGALAAAGGWKCTIQVTHVDLQSTGNGYVTRYFVGDAAFDTDQATTQANAVLAAKTKVNAWMEQSVNSGGLGLTLVGGDVPTKYTDGVNSSDGLAYVLGYRFTADTTADTVPNTGNLYGSSKDVGTITAKLPALTENGGRVNRVGFKRIEIEGTLEKFGFFHEFTQESLDFDSDDMLMEHTNREMILGANEITEDALQIDLLNAAGVVRYGGIATTTAQLTGENGATPSVATYQDLQRLSVDLDDNRTPKSTKIITGTRLIDTKTIDAARPLYIGSEIQTQLKNIQDSFNNQAFIPVHKYAAAGTVMRGEIGAIDQWRIIVVPEMMHWEGAGATVTTNDGYRETGGKYDVFPMLAVGSQAFTTIGFQTDGKEVKFKIITKKPGEATADRNDPFGELGFMSIKWYYGFMLMRPERIALFKVVAQW